MIEALYNAWKLDPKSALASVSETAFPVPSSVQLDTVFTIHKTHEAVLESLGSI